MPITVVGVDQSYSCTGIVVLSVRAESDGSALTFSRDVLHEEGIKTKTGPHHFERAVVIRDRVVEVCKEFRPEYSSIESPAFAQGTMLASLGGLYFLTLEALLQNTGREVLMPDPSKVKYWATRKITDPEFLKDRADFNTTLKGKDQVKEAYRLERDLAPEVKVNDNIADAFFIAEMGGYFALLREGVDLAMTDYEAEKMTDTHKRKGEPIGLIHREGLSFLKTGTVTGTTGG